MIFLIEQFIVNPKNLIEAISNAVSNVNSSIYFILIYLILIYLILIYFTFCSHLITCN